jgi:hypothetical protein
LTHPTYDNNKKKKLTTTLIIFNGYKHQFILNSLSGIEGMSTNSDVIPIFVQEGVKLEEF